MSSGIYSALSGAIAQERNLAVVANNVANVSTNGYKADRVAFNEALAEQAQSEPQRSVSMRYAALNRVQVDTSAGGLEVTGRPLDFALLGDAYFSVRSTVGDQFTRAGSFLTDSAGVVRNQRGDALLMEGGNRKPEGIELTLPAGVRQITVGDDGTINADGQSLGRLRLRSFARPEDMRKAGATHFVPQDGATVLEAGDVKLVQGSLEMANMNAVQGLNEMITLSRTFDAMQKIIQTFRSIDDRAVRDIANG